MSTNNAEQSVLNFASVLLALGSTNNNHKSNPHDDYDSIAAASDVSDASTNMSTSDVRHHSNSIQSTSLRVPRVSQSSVMSMFHGHNQLCQASFTSSSSQSSQMAVTTVDTGSYPTIPGDISDTDMKRQGRRRGNSGSSNGSSHDQRPKNNNDRRVGIAKSSSSGLDTTSHLFHLAQQCESRSVSTSQCHTMDDQGSMATYQGSGLPCNTQLAKTELQLLSALGRRVHSGESPDKNHNHHRDSFFMQSHQESGGQGKETDMETEEDSEEALKAAAAANRGKYKCSRCGAVKSNHNCPVMEQFTIADSTQYETMVLTASEFNSTYVGKLSSSSSSAIDVCTTNTSSAAGAGMSSGVSIDLSGLSVANCLRMLPVRPNYVPVVPSHALKKPMRYHRSDPTTTTAVDAASGAASSSDTNNNYHNDNTGTHSNSNDGITSSASGNQGQGSGGLYFLAPRMLAPDEYVIDETARNSITEMMHLTPGVLYLPIPTSFLLEGGGLQLAAMSLMTGEPVGVFSLTSSLVAGGGSGGAASGSSSSSSASSSSSSSSSQDPFAGHATELYAGTDNKQDDRNNQQALPNEPPKYNHQVVFQPIFLSPTASHSARATTVPASSSSSSSSSSSPSSSSSSSSSAVGHCTSNGTGTD